MNDEEDFDEEEDEQENMQLEASWVQKLFAPFYIVLFVVFLVAMSIPLIIIYTIISITHQAANY